MGNGADTITRGRIAGAYEDLAEKPGAFVSVRRLREALPALDLDAALVELYREQTVNLIPQSNQAALTEADRAAAVTVGGERKHLVSWEQD